MSAHASNGLTCSGSSRWLACPGSVLLTRDLPNPSSPFAEEGTRAHEVAEAALRKGVDAAEVCDDLTMAEFVQVYLDYVRDLGGDMTHIEERVAITDWVPDAFGTADYIAYHETDGVLDVCDLKYGAGVKVYAERNPQAMLYAGGVVQAIGHLYSIDRVRLHIIQPRLCHIDTWEIGYDELLEWLDATVKPTAEQALQPGAPLNPGESQCRWCLANATCTARAEANLALAREEFGVLPAPQTLTLEQIAAILPRLPDFEAWAKDVRQYAEQQALAGEAVPGFKLVEGRSVRQWRDEQQVIAGLVEQGYAPEEFTTSKLLGLGAMEKLLGGKKAAKPFMDAMTVKPQGKPALVPDSDKRPALEQLSAADEFSDAA